MAELSVEFWGLVKICACIEFGNMRKILTLKRLQLRGLTSSKWTSCTALLREKNRFYTITLVSRDTRQAAAYGRLLTKGVNEFSVCLIIL